MRNQMIAVTHLGGETTFNTPINFDTDTLGGIKTSKCT